MCRYFTNCVASVLNNADFAEDWNLYHRQSGEVHCGTVVRRKPFGFLWSSNQP